MAFLSSYVCLGLALAPGSSGRVPAGLAQLFNGVCHFSLSDIWF